MSSSDSSWLGFGFGFGFRVRVRVRARARARVRVSVRVRVRISVRVRVRVWVRVRVGSSQPSGRSVESLAFLLDFLPPFLLDFLPDFFLSLPFPLPAGQRGRQRRGQRCGADVSVSLGAVSGRVGRFRDAARAISGRHQLPHLSSLHSARNSKCRCRSGAGRRPLQRSR